MNILSKYVWLVDVLRQAGDKGLTKAEIDKKWKNSSLGDGDPIPRQTFIRWKEAAWKIMRVEIACDRRNYNRYFISNPEDLKPGGLSNWLLDTYSTFELLSNYMSLHDRVLLEDVPSAKSHLVNILKAMDENKVIEMTYEGFGSNGKFTCKVQPYCVRLMDRRWYMVALYTKIDKLRIYGVDRIKALTITDETFVVDMDFDAKDYFRHCFGVVRYESAKTERVVIRATKPHYNYLRSLPLHQSQQEIFACDEYVDFEMYLRPTYDFCYELLRHADMVEVTSPQSLRDEMRGYLQRMLGKYE